MSDGPLSPLSRKERLRWIIVTMVLPPPLLLIGLLAFGPETKHPLWAYVGPVCAALVPALIVGVGLGRDWWQERRFINDMRKRHGKA